MFFNSPQILNYIGPQQDELQHNQTSIENVTLRRIHRVLFCNIENWQTLVYAYNIGLGCDIKLNVGKYAFWSPPFSRIYKK